MRAIPIAVCILGFALLATPSLAKEPSIFADLAFDPQETVREYSPEAIEKIKGASFSLEVRDGRNSGDPTLIGQGTTPRKREFAIRSGGDPIEFLEDGLRKSAAGWGLIVDSGSELSLEASLNELSVVEDGKWVGSKYRGRVEVAFELRDAQDEIIWVGRAAGEATRFGRKQNVKNMNEVLSDALKQAFAALMDTSPVRGALMEDAVDGS